MSATVYAATSTAPSPDISALIDQLGDDNFSVREAAGDSLLKIGPPARDALQQAATSAIPEIRLRAAEILHEIDVPTFPGVSPDQAGGLPDSIQVNSLAGTVVVNEGGRTIQIRQNLDGIEMTVDGFINGKPATAHFKAATPEELRAKSPDAYQQWQQYHSQDGQVTLLQGDRPIFIRGGGLIINNANINPVDQTDDFAKLNADLVAEMDQKHFTGVQENRLQEQVEKVRLARESLSGQTPPNDPRQTDYLKACDDLRKQIADAGLPDPGPVLPPPASARLGVSVEPDPGFGSGIMINTVDKNSRGEKIGLLAGDVILVANGKPITSVSDLRVVATAERHLVLSVGRAGQEVKLEEPAPPSTKP